VDVADSSWVPVRDALVLAAGNGDRFHNGSRESKLLQPLAGRPLILRTLDGARQAGIERVEIVLGYQADRLRATIEAGIPRGLTADFCYNPYWHLENGVSVLAARDRFAGRFALLMGDHVFDPAVLARLLATKAPADESLLAVDTRPAPAAVAAEATRVRMDGEYIAAIGKDLPEYDALDTGMFVCAPAVFDAIRTARASGDTTLSGGIRELARGRRMRGVGIGDALWYDIDTIADLQHVESLLAEQAEHA
jgi:1L-myo-inositol 1-phosphate cytidylyltransferase